MQFQLLKIRVKYLCSKVMKYINAIWTTIMTNSIKQKHRVLRVFLPQCIMQITKPKWLLHCKGTIKYIRKQWTWPKLGCSISLHVCPFIHIPGASHWLRLIEMYNSTPKRLPVSHWLRFVVVYIGEYFSSPIRFFFISYAQYHSRTLNFSKIKFVQIYITVLIILVSILSKRANIYIGRIQDIIPSDIIPLTSRILRL
jgi:hypothetical protein